MLSDKPPQMMSDGVPAGFGIKTRRKNERG